MTKEIPDVEFVLSLAEAAGSMIRSAFYKQKDISYKMSCSDLLTKTDVEVEKFLIEEIKKKYPTHEFLCEESSNKALSLTDKPTWVIDPIDGTTNFVHMYPFVAVSIGFTIQKETVLGVIYLPILDEFFFAKEGAGSWYKNGGSNIKVRLNVANESDLHHSIVATGFTVSILRRASQEDTLQSLGDAERAKCAELKEITMMNTRRLIECTRDIRRSGSCATDLAFLAAGRLNGFCELGIKEWDIAAGVLIVKNAGGFVTDYKGNPLVDYGQRQIIAGSSKKLCEEIAAVLTAPDFDLKDLEG